MTTRISPRWTSIQEKDETYTREWVVVGVVGPCNRIYEVASEHVMPDQAYRDPDDTALSATDEAASLNKYADANFWFFRVEHRPRNYPQ